MKKILGIVLAGTLLFSFCACGNKNNINENPTMKVPVVADRTF